MKKTAPEKASKRSSVTKKTEKTVSRAAKKTIKTTKIKKTSATVQTQKKETTAYRINDLCINCNICLDSIGCPAFYLKNDEIKIDPNLCYGCGLCVQVCPNDAIEELEL